MVILFSLRIIFFAIPYGGIEHDSGWYLGVAKNLALKGKYASYTNTIIGNKTGANPSIHGRYSVQDKEGFIYFPAGVTVGPGYVIPEALIIKLFGNGWWQYRAWPFIAFSLLLFILFYIVLKLGGFISLLIFSFWLFLVPQLYIAYAYEAYSEPIALLYLLAAMGVLLKGLQNLSRKNMLYIFLAGVLVSFSILTKNLFILSLPVFLVPFISQATQSKNSKKIIALTFITFAVGIILPYLLFELYRYVTVLSLFGKSGVDAVNRDIVLTFQTVGSGLSGFSFSSIDWGFVNKKFNIWKDVGITWPLFIWLVLLVAPFMQRKSFIKNQLFWMSYIALVTLFMWFIFISPTGWARHAWYGIVIGMVLVSITLGSVLRKYFPSSVIKRSFFSLVIILIFFSNFNAGIITRNVFLTDSTILQWQSNRYIRGLEGFPSAPLLSLKDQEQLVNYFTSHITGRDKIYYAGWFLNAEVSPLVDKVFYSLGRYEVDNTKYPQGGVAYLIIGPYQQGKWSLAPEGYLERKTKETCKEIVYKNPSYLLCKLKENIEYNNLNYE